MNAVNGEFLYRSGIFKNQCPVHQYVCVCKKLSVYHLGYAKVKVFNLRQVNPLLLVILSKYVYVINKSILSKNTKIMQSVFRKEKPVTFIVQNIGM